MAPGVKSANAAMADELKFASGDGIAELILDAPASRNALSTGMIAALHARLEAIAADTSIRVVLLGAVGPAFSAGHDLKQIQAHRSDPDGGRAFYTELFAASGAMMGAIRALPQPVIAVVQGVAAAAGCQLVATCDLAVASEEARFGVNGIDAGFFCSTPGVALARNIGRKPAMELLLTGRFMDADEACAAGLVNSVVPAATLRDTARSLAETIAAKSGPVTAFGKRNFYQQIERQIAEAYDIAEAAMVENLAMDDCDEGIDAFLKKRQPDWKGS